MFVNSRQRVNKRPHAQQVKDPMGKHNKNYRQNELKIRRIEATSDRLTGRAGLALFVAYLHSIEIFDWFDRWFGSIRKNRKGLPITELFKQVLCFFVDGTSRRLTYFDQLREDEGYSGGIETDSADIASSHQVKRFFKAFAWTRVFLFRRLLQTLSLWRLRILRPEVVELGIDTMVMDNDDAYCRHGVQPTYKKRGFQPLQMNWGRLIVDAVFRGGDKHSNHSDTVLNMIRHMVIKIKRDYRWDVPIIIRMDSGFFDQKIFNLCETLQVGYLCGGKMYDNIKQVAANWDEKQWRRFESAKKESWQYAEFGRRQGNWKRFRRAVYCRLMHDDHNQYFLPGCRPDTVIVTNIGQGQAIDRFLKDVGALGYLTANGLIACYHERGSDELANRAIKDFGHEQLPFKQFTPNAAWYFMMLVGHFLLGSFKEDVSAPVVAIGAYASTVRRRLIDIAGKIVSHSGETILKVSQSCLKRLCLPELFNRCQTVPIIG
jgi:hypothetical protein